MSHIKEQSTVVDGLLQTIEELRQENKSQAKDIAALQKERFNNSIEVNRVKSEKAFIDGTLEMVIRDKDALTLEIIELKAEKENLSGKVSTLLMHLKNFCETWEARFDFNVQEKTADYSYEELQEYIEAATYLERTFNRDANRVVQAENMQNS